MPAALCSICLIEENAQTVRLRDWSNVVKHCLLVATFYDDIAARVGVTLCR
jgi:hypothetical protein